MERALEQPISGIHHAIALASDPRHDLGLYTEVPGLRLVKQTVSFDDPW
jgi:catechol 2,3-dioxygenase-like lactoylglutathione lyase family enzyme